MLLRCADQTLDLTAPVVMGVVNVTPDSFSDGGSLPTAAAAIEQGLRMAGEGAGIIDVGGESTRPGAQPVPVEEELARVLPVVQGLAASSRVVVSVDTSRPEVMREAARAGARLINDVRALSVAGALAAAAESRCAVCLMHMQGEPRTMQLAPHYDQVTREVREYLLERAGACRAAGIAADRLALDPGFGFGKTFEHNLTLLRELDSLTSGEYPVLIGVSRKSLIGKLTGRPGGERLYGGLALAAYAIVRGARIIRTHDVEATVDTVRALAPLLVGRVT